MTMEIKRLDVGSLAKIKAVVNFSFAMIIGFLIAVALLVQALAGPEPGKAFLGALLMGLAAVVLGPLLALIVGLIDGAILALVYNLFASWLGGIQLEATEE